MKESLVNTDMSFEDTLHFSLEAQKEDTKRHILYGGAHFLQHSDVDEGASSSSSSSSSFPPAPDGGCIGLVLRTGFNSSQGDLMRKILFASERITSQNSLETVLFILFMVVFATLASSFVLFYGLQDETRNQFKLYLHCIMIITSVIPPELPMELSLSVTNSLAALAKVLVFCTEPFRIPIAGKLDTLCFDKTGTLTKDQMVLKGIALPQRTSLCTPSTSKEKEEKEAKEKEEEETKGEGVYLASDCDEGVLTCMGLCHSLLLNKGAVVGIHTSYCTF